MLVVLPQCAPLIIAAFVGFTIVLLCYKRRKSGPSRQVPKDTVLIFGVGRGALTPCLSPFPLKLETFCRMAQIPYMVDHGHHMSSKGKTPWMLYNGQAVADSQFCIEHLKTERGLDLDADLSPSLKAEGRAFRELTEENFYWTLCHEMFQKHPEMISKIMPLGRLQLFIIKVILGRVVKKEMWGHGIGRHSDAEIWDIGVRDLTALSDFLGGKRYFLGDEPHEVDCTIFGMLAQVVYSMPGSEYTEYVQEHLPNIVAYVSRMKARYWPDWNERCVGDNYVQDEHKLYAPNPAYSNDP